MKVARVGAGISGRVRTLMQLLTVPNGRVTKKVNLNQYTLNVATRMARQDFVMHITDEKVMHLAYTPQFKYDVSLGQPPVLAPAQQQERRKAVSKTTTKKGLLVQNNQGVITNYFM